jgi:hypothetical protein
MPPPSIGRDRQSRHRGPSIDRQIKPPLILQMDSRLLPRSRARADVAQTHRFPEFLQAPRQTACQALLKGVKRMDWGSLGVMGAAGTGEASPPSFVLRRGKPLTPGSPAPLRHRHR